MHLDGQPAITAIFPVIEFTVITAIVLIKKIEIRIKK